ncbi:MAG: tripartite tricarboxylate transporter substrate binding protein [Betaproteobacteria bacterium]|nr:tripartite tricarboxylate transporter substrate binding protein [Betaproteobacteria bacterium]
MRNRWDGWIGAVIVGAWLASVCAVVFGADAPDPYPMRPLRLICPWPAGGIADLRSRQVAERLARALGQSVVVENRPGASGTVGLSAAAQAKPDGYTFVMGSVNDLGIAPALDPRANGRLASMVQPLTLAARGPMILVVSPKLGVRSIAELVALAKSQPGRLSYGSSGPNTTHHFAGEKFLRATGTQMIHVPYKGSAVMLPELVGGTLAMGFEFAATSEPLIKAGKLKALAVRGPRRVGLLPDVPTAREAGIPEVEAYSWSAYLVPAGTPQPIANQLASEIVKILRAPDMTQAYNAAGYEVIASTPEELGAFLREEQVYWAKLARELGMVQ